jgi:hypothetical protein
MGKNHSTNRSNTRKGDSVGAVPRNFRPPRDRPVFSKGVVACPGCGAGIDDDCVSSVTGLPTSPHPLRRRMALRKEREQ